MSKITYELIPVKELKIEKYNRLINIADAKKKAAEWDENAVGLIVVSKRDNVYHIIDGQHRVYAANLLRKSALMCQVIEGLTYEEEAALFVKLNKNRRGLLIFDYIKALHEAKDNKIMDLWDAVESVGFTISNGGGHNKIQAVKCLINIYEKLGKQQVVYVLKILRDVWAGDEKSLINLIIDGMNEFIKTYQDEFNEMILINHLKKVEPSKLVSLANSDMTNCSKKTKMARAILYYYNYGLRTGRLKDKFTS